MSVNCCIRNYDALKKKLEQMQKAPKAVLQRTMGDVKSRVPGWVASEVSQHYGVKKGEITGQKIGKVKIQGDSIQNVKLIYTGRVLTPTHFNMTPKAPGKNAYTLKAEILRGQKATLGKVKKLTKKQRAALAKNFTRSGTQNSTHSPIMLMHTGNGQAGGTNYIPFQRKSTDRDNVEAIKTLSLPQMISGERAHDDIAKAINDGLEKRLNHYIDRYMG